MPGTFRAYARNIEAKSGKSLEDFWKLANRLKYVQKGKVVAPHALLLSWLKSDVGLGHVHANFVIMYLRLRSHDSKVSEGMKKWALSTGYVD